MSPGSTCSGERPNVHDVQPLVAEGYDHRRPLTCPRRVLRSPVGTSGGGNPLVNLELDEDDPNCQYVDDYKYWLGMSKNFARNGEEDGNKYRDDEDNADEEDESWDEEGALKGGLRVRRRGLPAPFCRRPRRRNFGSAADS